MKACLLAFAVCAAVGWGGSVRAQTGRPVTNNPQVSLVTTGGVSYAEYTWLMGGCLTVSNIGPLLVEGSDFSFDFEIAMQTGVACPQDVFFEYATVVLGALAPGAHTLTTTSWGSPVSTNIFNVPQDSGPMIQAAGFGGDGSFQMQLNGVPNVGYVLQSSTNLAGWVSLSTNYPGFSAASTTNATATMTLTDTNAVPGGLRFYRLLIPETVYLHP